MKVFLVVCLGLLVVVSSGWGEAVVVKHDELTLKTLDEPALKDPAADIPSLRNVREAEKKNGKNKAKNAKKPKGAKNTRKNKAKKGKNGKATRKGSKQGKNKNNKPKKKTGRNGKAKKVKTDKKTRKSKRGKVKKTRKSKKGKGKIKTKKTKGQQKRKQDGSKKRKKIKAKSRKAKNSKKGKNSVRPQSRLVCGESQVNDTCLQNAVDALNFEKNQIQSFFKQKARIKNQNKTTGGKLGKKGEFEDAAKYLLQAIGGNLSAPTCGESGTANKARSAKSASDTYRTLLNCSSTIKEACTMPTHVFNATVAALQDTCAFTFNKSKTAADDCRTNKAYLTNGTAACACWVKAAIGIKIAKAQGCSATDTSKLVKASKNKCIKAFGVCKKAEDAAVGLIHTCMAGEVKNISATGRMVF